MPQSQFTFRGIPLKDRTADQVRAAMEGQDADTTAAFLRLFEYAQGRGLGLSKLATQTRINQAILSECFNGVYPGRPDEIAQRIVAFFHRLEQQEKYGGLRAFVDTQLAGSLWSVFDKTRVTRKIQIVEGPEQVGKSRAAEEYAERNNSGRTEVLEVPGGSVAGLGLFINDLADALGIAHTIKQADKRLRIKHALESCDLLIIDEAHNHFRWTDRCQADWWDYLRTDLYANGKRGIVMMYTNQDAMSGVNAWRRRAGYNVGQLLGRMHPEVIRIDAAEDLVEDDVAAIVARYLDGAKPTKGTVRTLLDLGIQQPGHLAFVIDVLNESWIKAKARRRTIDDTLILEQAQAAVREVARRKDMYR